jgi:hypothetical protein
LTPSTLSITSRAGARVAEMAVGVNIQNHGTYSNNESHISVISSKSWRLFIFQCGVGIFLTSKSRGVSYIMISPPFKYQHIQESHPRTHRVFPTTLCANTITTQESHSACLIFTPKPSPLLSTTATSPPFNSPLIIRSANFLPISC